MCSCDQYHIFSYIAWEACPCEWMWNLANIWKSAVCREPRHSESRRPKWSAGVLAKAHRAEVPKERSTASASELLDRAHSDVSALLETSSIGWFRYSIRYIENYWNTIAVCTMKRKSDAAACYLDCETWVERSPANLVRAGQSNPWGEELGTVMENYSWGMELNEKLLQRTLLIRIRLANVWISHCWTWLDLCYNSKIKRSLCR